MRRFQFSCCRLLAILFVISSSLFVAADDERGDTHELKTFFRVTVREGPSAGLVASGVLTLNVKSGTGNFTGTLTPGQAEGAEEPLSSVVFHQVDHKFVPDGDVKEIDVRGTLHGHAINLIALNAGGEGKDIFGVGTTENAFGEEGGEQALGHIAGPAVGPEEGDSGDWIVSLQPIPFRAPPIINSANTTTFLEFRANSFTATTSGVPLPVFSETGTLPSGVTFGSNGVLSGTPTQAGTFPITINAANGIPLDGVQNFILVINKPPYTFASSLSPAPVIVASFSNGVTGQCSVAPAGGQSCGHILSMTVTSAENPDSFGTFVANASNVAKTAQRFSGTLGLGDVTILNSSVMIVTNVSLGGASPTATLNIFYE